MAKDGGESLGSLAKAWLRAKATELTTGNRQTRDYADQQAYSAQSRIGERLSEEAMYAAFPGMRRARDRREAAEAARHDAEQRRISALPRVTTRIAVTGPWVSGTWSGDLPAETRPVDEDGVLYVEVHVPEDEPLLLGGRAVLGVALAVPSYAGPGHYDLQALGTAAERDGGFFAEWAWTVTLDNEETILAWGPTVGAAAIDVTDGGATLHFRGVMSGDIGDHYVDVLVREVPAPPAA